MEDGNIPPWERGDERGRAVRGGGMIHTEVEYSRAINYNSADYGTM